MTSHLIPCPAPSADELATLTAERPVRIDGNFVHRFRDARGHVRYERVTSGWGEPRWFRVEG